MTLDPDSFLRGLFEVAVRAADPLLVVGPNLPTPPAGRTIVVGAGKAAARMARAVEQAWTGPLEGLVVTRYGYGEHCRHIEVVEAGHPLPDAAAVAASSRIRALVSDAGADDLVLVLLSGGGSALLTLPATGVTVDDIRATTSALLRRGVPIAELNVVRRHLSALAGGRLAAAAAPARVVALVISDVVGDDPAVIASGPVSRDPSSPGDALDVLDRYRISVPPAVRARLRGASDAPDPAESGQVTVSVIATARRSLDAAARTARQAGVEPIVLGDAVEGTSRRVASEQAGLVAAIRAGRGPGNAPCVLLSGGETTVDVHGDGVGGPNAEFALALALALDGADGVWALAGDTDGVDGGAEIAGAVVGPTTLSRAASIGLDARQLLDDNDAHTYFAALADGVVTGPTRTNVNDFRALLVL